MIFQDMVAATLAALISTKRNATIGGHSQQTAFPDGQIGNALGAATMVAAKAEIVATTAVRLERTRKAHPPCENSLQDSLFRVG